MTGPTSPPSSLYGDTYSKPTRCEEVVTQPNVEWPHAAVFFGTWQQAGHFHFLPGMRSLRYGDVHTPWHNKIDRAPTWGRPSRSRYGGTYGQQGDAVLRHKDGWTALAVADYTVDSRPNSHATFAFLGDLTFEQAVEAAREHFPQIVSRVGEIRQVPGGE